MLIWNILFDMFPNENLKINALLHVYPFAMDKV